MACSANQEQAAISNFALRVINLFILRPIQEMLGFFVVVVVVVVVVVCCGCFFVCLFGFFFFFFLSRPPDSVPRLKKAGEIQWGKNPAAYANTRYNPERSSPVLFFFFPFFLPIKLINCALLLMTINMFNNK